MRSHFIRFGLIPAAAVAAACTTAHRAGLPERSEARVRVHPAGHPGPAGLVTKPLLACRAPAHDVSGSVGAAAGSRSVARNGLGDVLAVPADAVPAGTSVKVVRGPGRTYRWVEASAGSAAPPATLTIDLRGCTQGKTGLFIVRWVPALSAWDSVGGTVADSAITADLPHLSIYAVVGGRDPAPDPEPAP
ncbi:MAG: hypothetical protein ACJ8J0_25995 [Longimicrobiaceae bacterium]